MTTRREKLRQAAVDEIKTIAWEMLKNNRPVTIHQITKKMGMTAPAFYTYFTSRDALMAQLVSDSLTSFYQALSAPFKGIPKDSGVRIRTIFIRYRSWAVTHPNAFSLFAGTPVSGFNADQNPATAGKIYRFIFDLFHAAEKEGRIMKLDVSKIDPAYADQLESVRNQIYPDADISTVHQVIRLVSQVHGLISLELSGRFIAMADDWEQVYRTQIFMALQDMGICATQKHRVG